MALAYTNINVELREISLRDRPKELYDVSSKATVPVLIASDGLVIDESLDIMLWSLKNDSNQTWLSDNHKAELDMITENDTIFKKWLDRYKYHDRYPENSKEFYRNKCHAILLDYNNRLGKTKYLLANSMGIADVAIFPFIRQFSYIDYQWFENNYSQLELWFKQISLSDLFISVMNKYDTWNNKNKGILVNFKS